MVSSVALFMLLFGLIQLVYVLGEMLPKKADSAVTVTKP